MSTKLRYVCLHTYIAMASSVHDLPSNSYHVPIAIASSTHDLPSNSYHVAIVYKSDMQTFSNFTAKTPVKNGYQIVPRKLPLVQATVH